MEVGQPRRWESFAVRRDAARCSPNGAGLVNRGIEIKDRAEI